MLRQEHFRKKNEEELDRQLEGIHRPPQPLQKILFVLPERRTIANIFSDLDEDVPEEKRRQRKIDAVNALVAYAWKMEPREPQTPPRAATDQVETAQARPVLPMQGRPIAPRPPYASMIREAVSPPPPMTPDAAMIMDPPPPYSEVGSGSLACPDQDGPAAMSVSRQRNPRRRHKCMFCEATFTRKATMWNCVDRHLMRRKTETVACPDRDCKSKGTVLDNEVCFKNHAQAVHNFDLRPKVTRWTITTRSVAPDDNATPTTRIIIRRRIEQPKTSPRIILRLGRQGARRASGSQHAPSQRHEVAWAAESDTDTTDSTPISKRKPDWGDTSHARKRTRTDPGTSQRAERQ
ncbi:hypothetical protein NKR23_g12446 [Pleurostoma richardsiae]|uniref:Uncharacterized protein n=1 Tax=Pleurostoma richardsiae TaxID=41990 RepID=A0AA38VFY3_9PEZI|nr:hypothetical protein NKR23_g12446 [Pleurostoma richardsiae]